ncbi:CidA/LrgA family protein [Enterobacter cloacae subsp. cloacae]|nr:CidA/LrgA family protein [Enterobacter cloacae subsp. cloacae]
MCNDPVYRFSTALRGTVCFAEYLVGWLHLPLPANLVGMVLMLTRHSLPRYPLNWVRAGATLAAGRNVAVLCSAVAAVVNYRNRWDGGRWRIFAVIALSTLMVLGTTPPGVVDRFIASRSAGKI